MELALPPGVVAESSRGHVTVIGQCWSSWSISGH